MGALTFYMDPLIGPSIRNTRIAEPASQPTVITDACRAEIFIAWGRHTQTVIMGHSRIQDHRNESGWRELRPDPRGNFLLLYVRCRFCCPAIEGIILVVVVVVLFYSVDGTM